MRITDVHMPVCPDDNDGLGPIEMTRLNQVVLIAGKNGSGKSRLLRRLVKWAQRAPNSEENLKANIAHSEMLVKGTTRQPDKNNHQSTLTSYKTLLRMLNWIQVSPALVHPAMPTVIEFVPKGLKLRDSFNLPPSELLNAKAQLQEVGAGHLEAWTLPTIQYLQNRQREASHPESTVPAEEKKKALADYKNLKFLVRTFLGEELSRSLDMQAELFGRRIGEANLSDGQKILLQFCVAIHAQAGQLSDLIVIMDEPENHLHPSAMLDAIVAIQKYLTQGQLWIATHSAHLLSHFEPSNIWWMENNEIQYAGNATRKVLQGLLGDEDRISRLSEFLALPFELASSRFAYQSLFAPAAVQTEANDPQTKQITEILKQFNVSQTVRILDYGAGKGRLASAIHDAFVKDSLKNWFDYIAFDATAYDRPVCEASISRIYGNSCKRYFNESTDLLSSYDSKSFDVVVMCNVLHEIPASDWLTLFAPHSLIMKTLKDDGFLLLVEDMKLPVGEKPHQKGFLVLDTPQLKTLFKITASGEGFTYDAQQGGRLKAHRIPKACLSRIDGASKRAAIEEVHHEAKQQVKALRKSDASYQNGRLHGFWVQQLANSQLALDEL